MTRRALRIFLRDGFIDRYSGERLVFPGSLRLLSLLLPDEIPYQLNWNSECDPLYWALYPTLDHVVAVARGGADCADNLVCTSMLLNAQKGQWTLEELGWNLLPPGDSAIWDGMLRWFLEYVQAHEQVQVLFDASLRRWHRAALWALRAEEAASATS